MKLDLHQIAQWCGAELHPHSGENLSATGYSIDSRTIEPGDLFFAVRGDRFDGHDFAANAFANGAIAAVVTRHKIAALPSDLRRKPLLAVDDPLAALQQ